MPRAVLSTAGIGLLLGGAMVALAIAPPEAFVRWWAPDSRPELRELVAAMGRERIADGRLSGGFAWAPSPSATRGAVPTATSMAARPVKPEVQIAAAHLEQRAAANRSARNLAALGTAHVATGRTQEAVDALEEAVALAPSQAFAWSDLSVAYLARSAMPGATADLARALEAAERALALSPSRPEARFNRALALDRLGLVHQSIDAWKAVPTADPSSDWVSEAHGRLAEIERRRDTPPTAHDLQSTREQLLDVLVPRWAEQATARQQASAAQTFADAVALVGRLDGAPGDRLAADILADLQRNDRRARLDGYVAYGRGRMLYKRDQMDDAAHAFDEAIRAFDARRSPLRWSARLYRGLVAYRQQQLASAEQQLTALLPQVTPHAYASLVGRITWTLGVIATHRGAYAAAGQHYRLALQAFTAADEVANGAFVHFLLAENYERRGESERGWPDRLLGLAGNGREGVFLQSAHAALRMNWPHVAAAMQAEAVTIARAGKRLTNLADALRVEALTNAALGRPDAAERSLNEAHAIVSEQRDSAWARLRNEIDLATARIAPAERAADGIAAATRAYDFFMTEGSLLRVPETLLARARLERATGANDRARHDLAQAVDVVLGQRDALPPGIARMALAETAQHLGEARVSLEQLAGSPQEALIEADRLRAWDLGASSRGVAPRLDLDALRQSLAPDTTIVYYSIGDDESFVWTLRRAALGLQRLAVNRGELQRLITGAPSARFDSSRLRRLYDVLIQPIAGALNPGGRLVVVPDGPLHQLPFAELPGVSSRFFTEEHILSQSPSLGALVAATKRIASFGDGAQSAIAIGNPRIDPSIWPDLPALPGAAAEAQQIAALYPSSRVLIAQQATSDTLSEAMTQADVLHFAGHAIANDLYPEESQLGLLSRDGTPVTAVMVSQLSATRLRVVVLAACESLGRPSTRGQGPMSLARAFLQAGVPIVVANRWLVDDRAAVAMSTAFHRAYRDTGDAAGALHAAQMAMIHAADERLRHPSAWAGWTVIGALTPSFHKETP